MEEIKGHNHECCNKCGGDFHGHSMKYHILRKILLVVVIVVAVGVGMKLGELKAICEGVGHGGWGQYQSRGF